MLLLVIVKEFLFVFLYLWIKDFSLPLFKIIILPLLKSTFKNILVFDFNANNTLNNDIEFVTNIIHVHDSLHPLERFHTEKIGYLLSFWVVKS